MAERKHFTVRKHFTPAAPKGPQPPLQKGSRVHEAGSKSNMGVIEEHGPEVSGIRFDDGAFRYINMAHLVNKGMSHGKD